MPVLVDTSVWIDHFRKKEPALVALLESAQVLGHPFVRGELALGNLPQRHTLLELLDNLPQTPVAFGEEINRFIEANTLFGLGIGFVDVHLLASAKLALNATLWTRDNRLLAVATQLNVGYQP
ncbi:type II toxin-antitoxin system VapC family toxin [Methylotuvimicrobium alcaliphilum]|uniref:PilT protein domain protein n=1 Tax=Methylotuvimicrobium alcaliphilum (strain DSM 19304 / NCIMB 14124 / VKM B-2133 / 20Z) TaxID=1091494 RepID=G4ST86_META2|nr:type II toxin-antitoxin system VapC family toxin [Methylotuvimicrobium alcaliphilum]CCE23839.1 PilT protein domain protein [Methylotuvimicrobium alcaliphilum 20Z]